MFTGIVEEIGRVRMLSPNENGSLIVVEAKEIFGDISVGDSIAVNGVCLTAKRIDDHSFVADISKETMRISSIGTCVAGCFVNLERALQSGARFGGHIVSGHIDGTGLIKNIKKDKGWVLTVEVQEKHRNYMIHKGSISVDGVSLTISDFNAAQFSVALIPHTVKNTTIQFLKTGDTVNIECDVIAKYVESFLHPFAVQKNKSKGLTNEFLAEHGLI